MDAVKVNPEDPMVGWAKRILDRAGYYVVKKPTPTPPPKD